MSDDSAIAGMVFAAGAASILYYMLSGNECKSKVLKGPCSFQTPNRRKHIEVIESEEECKRAVKILRKHLSSYNVLGFDCEWIPSTRYNARGDVALVQLATHEGYCALFRLCRMGGIPKCLRDFLQLPNLIAVGVDACEDAQKLGYDYNISIKNTLDLRFFAVATGNRKGTLKNLALNILGVKLPDVLLLSFFEWEATELSDSQIVYAADDALVAIEIYKKLAAAYISKGGWLIDRRDDSTLQAVLNKYMNKKFVDDFHSHLPSILD